MRPHVICHMLSSIDGRLAPSRWTASPDGTREQWSALYGEIHEALDVQGWIVGRVTMAEMAKGEAHPPHDAPAPARPVHVAAPDATSWAIALDRSARLHFAAPDIYGDYVVVLLGHDVPDSHLAELAGGGISYLVATGPEFDLADLLDRIGEAFGIRRLALEGGGGINGSFLAAGLVDELSIIVAPALDGRSDSRAIVESGDEGLAGRIELSLSAVDRLPSGAVHLRYAVASR